MEFEYLIIFLPLIGSIISGFFGKFLGSRNSEILTSLFVSISAIFSFLNSLGHHFLPFYKIFYFYFPYFDKFRVPVYILILFYFSIMIFTAFGIEYLIEIQIQASL